MIPRADGPPPVSPAADLLAGAVKRLRGAGIDSAQVDAELLLAHCLDVARSRLHLVDEPESPVARRFLQLVARRESREPLQYITGEAPFRHLVLAVGAGVFVPRPETELLVDAALAELASTPRPVVVDLCSGSGALALSIAHELPGTRPMPSSVRLGRCGGCGAIAPAPPSGWSRATSQIPPCSRDWTARR